MTLNTWPSRGWLPCGTKKRVGFSPEIRPGQGCDEQLHHQRQHRPLGAAHRQHGGFQAPGRVGGELWPCTRPVRKWLAYVGTRDKPCDASPCASALTRASAVGAACAKLAPAGCKAWVLSASRSWKV